MGSALALRWTHSRAAAQLLLADEVIDRLPRLFTALDNGQVDVPRARVVADLLGCVDDELAAGLVDRIIEPASRLTTAQLRAQLRARLRRLLIAVDPQAAAAKARQGITERRVAAYADDGTHLAALAGYELAPHRVAAVMERLDAIARAGKAAGDGRSMDQLRADAFLDLLSGEGIAAGGPVSDGALGLAAPGPGCEVEAEPVPWPVAPAAPELEADPGWDDRADSGPTAVLLVARVLVARVWSTCGRRASARRRSAPAGPSRTARTPARSGDGWPFSIGCPPAGRLPGAGCAGTWTGCRRRLGRCRLRGRASWRWWSAWTRWRGGPTCPPSCPASARSPHRSPGRPSVRCAMRSGGSAFTTRSAGWPTTAPAVPVRRGPAPHQAVGTQAGGGPARSWPPSSKRGTGPAWRLAAAGPARRCDIDHTVDWVKGGETVHCNVGLLCRLHRLFKHASGCELEQPTSGLFLWRTPAGMHYRTRSHIPTIDPGELADLHQPGG